jgi:hypothetical protein
MLTFAQFERELASERIRDKCAQRAQRGLYNGGRPPFGYRKEQGKLVVDPGKAHTVRFMFEKFIETRSAYQVTLALRDKWHDRRLLDSFPLRVLRNPAVTGKVVYKGKVMPGVHEPIISEEVFNHAQAIFAEEAKKERKPSSTYHNLPYAGIIECQECGSRMTPTHTDKVNGEGTRRYYYYRCTSTNHKGWNACGTRQINAARLENMIDQNLIRLSRDPLYLQHMLFSLKNSSQQPGQKGIEPPLDLDRLTPEILQKSLLQHVKSSARKTGIEKALAVRQGVEKVFYGKDRITVRFLWTRPLDGKMASDESDSSAALRAAGVDSSASGQKEKPDSLSEPGSSCGVATNKLVEQIARPPTVDLTCTNISHDYWENYRMTGEYNVRPTLGSSGLVGA